MVLKKLMKKKNASAHSHYKHALSEIKTKNDIDETPTLIYAVLLLLGVYTIMTGVMIYTIALFIPTNLIVDFLNGLLLFIAMLFLIYGIIMRQQWSWYLSIVTFIYSTLIYLFSNNEMDMVLSLIFLVILLLQKDYLNK